MHFWYQTLIDLVLDISILTLDMSVNNTSNSSFFHILLKKEFEVFQTFFSLSISGEKLDLYNLLVFIDDT